MKAGAAISARCFASARVFPVLALLILVMNGIAVAEPPGGIGDTGPGVGDTGAAPTTPPKPSSHQHFFTGGNESTVPSVNDLFAQSSWQEISLPTTEPGGHDLNALVARLAHSAQQIVRDSAKPGLPKPQQAQVAEQAQKQVIDLETAMLRTPVSLSMQVIDVFKRDEPKRPSARQATVTTQYQQLLAAYEQDKDIYPESTYVAVGKLDWQASLSPSPQQQVQLDKLKTALQKQLDAADATHQDKLLHVTNTYTADQDALTRKLEHGAMTQSDYSQRSSDIQQEQSDEMAKEQTHYDNVRAKLNRAHNAAVKGVIGNVGLNRPSQIVYLFSADPAVMNWHAGQRVTSDGVVWKTGLFCYTAQGEARPFAPARLSTTQPDDTADDSDGGGSENSGGGGSAKRPDFSAAYLGAEVLVKQVKLAADVATSEPEATTEPATGPDIPAPNP